MHRLSKNTPEKLKVSETVTESVKNVRDESYCCICDHSSNDNHIHCDSCLKILDDDLHDCQGDDGGLGLPLLKVLPFTNQIAIARKLVENKSQNRLKGFDKVEQEYLELEHQREECNKTIQELEHYDRFRYKNGISGDLETNQNKLRIKHLEQRINAIKREQIEIRLGLCIDTCIHNHLEQPVFHDNATQTVWICANCEHSISGFNLKKTLDEATY